MGPGVSDLPMPRLYLTRLTLGFGDKALAKEIFYRSLSLMYLISLGKQIP